MYVYVEIGRSGIYDKIESLRKQKIENIFGENKVKIGIFFILVEYKLLVSLNVFF